MMEHVANRRAALEKNYGRKEKKRKMAEEYVKKIKEAKEKADEEYRQKGSYSGISRTG